MEKVQILMSVYKPNLEYLRQQLASLDNQSWGNLELIIVDDGGVNFPVNEDIFKDTLKRIPYRFLTREENSGYIKAFERLIKNSTAEYIAFCDQDDIWEPEKIKKSMEYLLKSQSLIVSCAYDFIDENGNSISASQAGIRPVVWKTGQNIAVQNVFKTAAPGMTLLCKGGSVRAMMPVPENTTHDQWIISCAGIEGKVGYIDTPLVHYRRYGKNTSSTLKGIVTKKDYIRERIMSNQKTIDALIDKYHSFPESNELALFNKARIEGNIYTLCKYRYLCPDKAIFEIGMKVCPEKLFEWILRCFHRK